jgi:hypothetical protein
MANTFAKGQRVSLDKVAPRLKIVFVVLVPRSSWKPARLEATSYSRPNIFSRRWRKTCHTSGNEYCA